MAKPIGILGGTFDPVHNGHLRMAIECFEKLDLEEVRLIPLHTPPHRHKPIASPEQRFELLQMATTKLHGLTVDDCELQKGGLSYTIDTVHLLRERHRESSLCLLVGMDAFNTINSWYRWKELLNYVHIVITERPGNSISTDDPTLKEILGNCKTDSLASLHDFPSGKIFEVTMPLLDISSSQIREILISNKNAAMLLPEGILEFIKNNHIYS